MLPRRSTNAPWWRGFAAVCLWAASMPGSVRANEVPALVVATYAYPQRDRIAAIRPLADYLKRLSARTVEVKLLPSPAALVEAMDRGEVDVAVPNLYGYLQAKALGEHIVALPVPEVPKAQAGKYRAVLVARAGIDSVAALQREAARLRLVLVGADSASGGFVPVAYLKQLGLEADTGFAALTHAGSHAAALAELAEGRADVAALAAEVFDAQVPADVHELWRSSLIPPGPLLCRKVAVDCAQVRDWLLEAHVHDPQVMAGLRAGWPEFGDAVVFTMPLIDAKEVGSID